MELKSEAAVPIAPVEMAMTLPSPISKFGLAGEKGFTLVELLMVIVILGVISVMSLVPIGQTIDEARFQETMTEMRSIRQAMIGDPSISEGGSRSRFGYLGDVGAIPTTAQGIGALLVNPGLPVWTLNQSVRFGLGWNGPYLIAAQTGADFSRDAWGNPYVYNSTSNPPTLTSYGADGVAGGAGFGSDITVEFPASLRVATVHGFMSSGGAPFTGTATVEINYPNGSGALTTTTRNLVPADNGYFSFPNIPLGKRSVTAYIPNRTSPTSTLGPFLLTVDSANYMVPTGALDAAPSVNPTPTPNPTPVPCTAGLIAYQAGSSATSGPGRRQLDFRVNVSGPTTIRGMIVTTAVVQSWSRFRADGMTADCSSGGISPCPVSIGAVGTLAPAMSLTSGLGKPADLLFDANVKGVGTVTVEFQYSSGCDRITIDGV